MFLILLIVVVVAIFLVSRYPWLLLVIAIVAIAIIVFVVIKRKKQQRFDEEYTVDYSFMTKVVGVTYNGIQNVLPTLKSGMPITLIREPNNPHDENAVAVKCGGRMIGHLDTRTAMDIARVMDNGIPVKGEISAITGGGNYPYGCNISVTVYKSHSIDENPTPQTTMRTTELKPQIDNIDKDNPFYNKVCVIYGFHSKTQVAQDLVNMGAVIKGSVTDKTDIVVTTYPDWLNSGTVNAEKAKALIAKGKKIQIMRRDEFISIRDKYLK